MIVVLIVAAFCTGFIVSVFEWFVPGLATHSLAKVSTINSVWFYAACPPIY